jgi:sec-independent protein translocase protein TatA
MFGTIGGPELVLIMIIGLIVFGPRKLPEIGKSVGKMIQEFRKASNDFKRTIEDEVEAEKHVTTAPPPALESPVPEPTPADGTVAQNTETTSTTTTTSPELEPEGTHRS